MILDFGLVSQDIIYFNPRRNGYIYSFSQKLYFKNPTVEKEKLAIQILLVLKIVIKIVRGGKNLN